MYKKECVFSNFIKVYKLTVPCNENSQNTMERYVASPADSVFVTVIDPVNKLILLCQEKRYGLPEEQWLQYGTIAGGLKPNEDPVEAAIREAEEETGIIIQSNELTTLPETMASMGVSTEKRYNYIYYSNLSNRKEQEHGLDEENENIISFVVDFHTFEQMLFKENKIKEPTMIMSYLYHKTMY